MTEKERIEKIQIDASDPAAGHGGLQALRATGGPVVAGELLTDQELLGMMLMVERNGLTDVVALGSLDGFEYVDDGLRCIDHVLLGSGALAARSLTGTASLFFLIFFHDDDCLMKNNSYLCNTKPEAGRVSPPFGTLKDDSQNCYLYFPNPKENCELHRASGFCFSLTLVSGLNQCQPLLIDTTKVRKIFELHKYFSNFFMLIPKLFQINTAMTQIKKEAL